MEYNYDRIDEDEENFGFIYYDFPTSPKKLFKRTLDGDLEIKKSVETGLKTFLKQNENKNYNVEYDGDSNCLTVFFTPDCDDDESDDTVSINITYNFMGKNASTVVAVHHTTDEEIAKKYFKFLMQ